MLPLKINTADNFLLVLWDNGSEAKYKLANLRKACPCAICSSEKENRGDSYIPIYTGDQLHISDIKVIGNYGINIIWKDGHNTGIYEFNQLSKLQSQN